MHLPRVPSRRAQLRNFPGERARGRGAPRRALPAHGAYSRSDGGPEGNAQPTLSRHTGPAQGGRYVGGLAPNNRNNRGDAVEREATERPASRILAATVYTIAATLVVALPAAYLVMQGTGAL